MTQKFLKEIEMGSRIALIKKKIVAHYLRNGSSTIPDLAKELVLSVPTVTKLIGEMSDDEFLIDYGKLETQGGRYPNLYGLNPEAGYFVGVEVRTSTINIGVINFKGEMISMEMNIPYNFENTVDGLDNLGSLISASILKSTIDTRKILNVNVSVCGRVSPDLGSSYTLFNFEERPLSEVLKEKLGYKVTINNDTRTMCYGEFTQGCAKGRKNVIFVNVSWGIGIGIIIDGKLYNGKSGFSGEFGHIASFDNEIICHCGKKGCLETEASGWALSRKLIERINNKANSILSEWVMANEGQHIPLEEILNAIKKEDTLSIEIMEEVGQKLGKHIAGLINIFNPDLVVVGGTLSLAEDYLFEPIKTAIRKYSLNLVSRDSEIVLSKLKDKAGVIGSCMVARRRMFEMV